MNYVPNKVPLKRRVGSIVTSLFLIGYGAYGVYNNDLYIAGKYGTGGMRLHDGPALMMFTAMLCGSLMMLATVVDHYDERNNEHKYKAFSKSCFFLSIVLMIGGAGWYLIG